MTTDTMDEIYERPTLYDLEDPYDRDPFGKKKGKRSYRIWKIAVILLLFFTLLLPQLAPKLIKLDNTVVEDKPLLSGVCSLNFFCHIVKEDNQSICICPPLIAKWEE